MRKGPPSVNVARGLAPPMAAQVAVRCERWRSSRGHDEAEVVVGVPRCLHVGQDGTRRRESGCLCDSLALHVAPVDTELDLTSQAVRQQPAGNKPCCAGGIPPAAAIRGDPVDKFNDLVTPIAEPHMADQACLTRLDDEQRWALQARLTPPAGKPIDDQCLTALETRTLRERDPHPSQTAVLGGVRV
jgi:hypothetical protein